jgi:GR25 family glycosyltransferase involved in LPS biosynthesis
MTLPKFICIYIFFLSALNSYEKKDLLQKFDSRKKIEEMQGIDEIYVINLEKRPKKLAVSLKQLKDFNFSCVVFSAINGASLDIEKMEAIAYKIHSKSCFETHMFGKNVRSQQNELISKAKIGQAVFYTRMTRGKIGCYLSHLSILQHALEKNYKRILILEDDFIIKEDPRCISNYIEELDHLRTPDGWDIIYLNDLTYYGDSNKRTHPEQKELFKNFLSSKISLQNPLDKLRILSSMELGYLVHSNQSDYGSFRKISGRNGTYAMVVNQSAMKKILSFFYSYGIFLPYDVELSFILDLNLFNIKKTIMDVSRSISDTKYIK